MRPQGLWALGPSAGSVGQVLVTPGELGGGGGLVRLPCAEKPGRLLPCAGLPRGPQLLRPCRSPAPGPGHPALQPGSAQVKRETQADGHSCAAAAGPGHCSGSPLHLLPCPCRLYRKDRQRNQPCAQATNWGGWSRCSPVLSPSLPRYHKASSQRRGAGWSQQCLRGLSVAPPSRPPPPTPSERWAEPHLRPPSPRSVSRPKAKSGLSRTQWSECPWQSFPPPAFPWWVEGRVQLWGGEVREPLRAD